MDNLPLTPTPQGIYFLKIFPFVGRRKAGDSPLNKFKKPVTKTKLHWEFLGSPVVKTAPSLQSAQVQSPVRELLLSRFSRV